MTALLALHIKVNSGMRSSPLRVLHAELRASKREMSSNNHVFSFKGPSIQGVPLEEIKNKIESVARVFEEKIEDQVIKATRLLDKKRKLQN